MDARDIEKYLSQLGEELADLGVKQPIRVLLLGGAFMLTQVKVRRTTDDIDVLPLDGGGIDEATGIPHAVALWNAAHAVAGKHELPDDWFNTLIAKFVRAAGEAPIQKLWRTYGPLEVYLPPKEYILVLKLIANREKDQADIAALLARLKIRSRDQAQKLVDTYISDREVQRFFAIHTALDKHFSSLS